MLRRRDAGTEQDTTNALAAKFLRRRHAAQLVGGAFMLRVIGRRHMVDRRHPDELPPDKRAEVPRAFRVVAGKDRGLPRQARAQDGVAQRESLGGGNFSDDGFDFPHAFYVSRFR